eukprot:6069-Rhodomonas_salina.1
MGCSVLSVWTYVLQPAYARVWCTERMHGGTTTSPYAYMCGTKLVYVCTITCMRCTELVHACTVTSMCGTKLVSVCTSGGIVSGVYATRPRTRLPMGILLPPFFREAA